MILHLVTDRLRLVSSAATDREAEECLLRQVDHAVEAGVDVVQIRERDLEGRRLCTLVTAAVSRAEGSATHIIVNDRVDVALACGAGGVHLRSDSMPAAAVRSIVPAGFLIGRSVHSTADALDNCEGADYLLAGTVWPTTSKPEGHRLLGLDGFAEIVAAVGVPVVAIGGVSLDHVPTLRSAGAGGIAGIGLFRDATRSGCRAVGLREMVTALRSSFC